CKPCSAHDHRSYAGRRWRLSRAIVVIESASGRTSMPDFEIIDSHVHLADPKRFSYGWTKYAPSLNRRVLVDDLMKAAAPVKIDRFVFVEVDVDLPQHLDEAAWIDRIAEKDKRLAGMV